MLTVLVYGILKRKNRVEEAVADSSELKTGGIKRLVCLLALCETVEVIGGVNGGMFQAWADVREIPPRKGLQP